jgi:hypothetical protein
MLTDRAGEQEKNSSIDDTQTLQPFQQAIGQDLISRPGLDHILLPSKAKINKMLSRKKPPTKA